MERIWFTPRSQVRVTYVRGVFFWQLQLKQLYHLYPHPLPNKSRTPTSPYYTAPTPSSASLTLPSANRNPFTSPSNPFSPLPQTSSLSTLPTTTARHSLPSASHTREQGTHWHPLQFHFLYPSSPPNPGEAYSVAALHALTPPFLRYWCSASASAGEEMASA